jgi:hypothetical protein
MSCKFFSNKLITRQFKFFNLINKKYTKKNFSTNTNTNEMPKNTSPENLSVCPNQLLKTKLGFGLAFFSIGGIVEIYTFSKTNDFQQSTGLGWGLLAALIVLP